jgi:hypothetical protein
MSDWNNMQKQEIDVISIADTLEVREKLITMFVNFVENKKLRPNPPPYKHAVSKWVAFINLI